ncbi:MAG: amidase [Actinomycetota bacterium]|nr:amidase [Actinomycetota bacterium]
MDETEIAYAGVAVQAELIRAKQISAVELTRTLLARIERLDPTLNAFRIVLAEEALAEAAVRDAEASSNHERGPLHGVPIAIKDELDVAGHLTTFGGAARTKPAAADSEPVRRLRAAGAIVIGKTRMPEFGQWPFTESAAGGHTRNPWDTTRTPGGSSGGTAAAVAAGMAAAGMGGDGGGSIRIPAACCARFGLKPQRGRVSVLPAADLWHALGTVGPLTRNVRDSALIYDAIRGNVPSDRYRAHDPAVSFEQAATTEPHRLRLAVCARPSALGVRLDPEQKRALEQTAETLRELGHRVQEHDLRYPPLEPAFVPQFYGGVRDEAAMVERPDLLERRTKQTLAIGRLFPAAAVRWAVTHGERLAARINRIFDDYDLLLTPTIPSVPRSVGALDGIGSLHASLRAVPYVAYTAVWNVCGNPAASVPAGFEQLGGLPLAAQLVAPPHDEATLLAVAPQLERAKPYRARRARQILPSTSSPTAPAMTPPGWMPRRVDPNSGAPGWAGDAGSANSSAARTSCGSAMPEGSSGRATGGWVILGSDAGSANSSAARTSCASLDSSRIGASLMPAFSQIQEFHGLRTHVSGQSLTRACASSPSHIHRLRASPWPERHRARAASTPGGGDPRPRSRSRSGHGPRARDGGARPRHRRGGNARAR